MKKIFVISLTTLVLIGVVSALMSFKSSSKEESIIVVTVFGKIISTSIGPEPKIIISDGTKIIKTVELEISKSKTIENNILKIVTELKEIKSQGYVLVSSNSGGGDAVQITNFVFEKR